MIKIVKRGLIVFHWFYRPKNVEVFFHVFYQIHHLAWYHSSYYSLIEFLGTLGQRYYYTEGNIRWYREGENLKNSNDFALFRSLTLWYCGSLLYATGNIVDFFKRFLLCRGFASWNDDFLILFPSGGTVDSRFWYARAD